MTYRSEDFERWGRRGQSSARVLVPLILELTRAQTVIDVGCGTGAWVAEFLRHDLSEVVGIDGWVDPSQLAIPEDRFVRCDLTVPFAEAIGRRFDLVVSLEVAEHLPPSSAESFVQELTKLGRTIVFSAAVPGQGGQQHLNEQWPSYWARLFQRCGYRAVDALRPRVWTDDRIEVWYRQNALLFTNDPAVAPSDPPATVLDLVHPRQYERIHRRWLAAAAPRTVRQICVELPCAIGRAIRHRLRS